MARSRHTEPAKKIAALRAQRRSDGTVVPPRVVRRKARPGDRHPISKKMLQVLLDGLPLQYTYGLTRVEMRAREADVGCPFALYRPSERAIFIYSVPLVWQLPADSWVGKSAARFDATVQKETSVVTVAWNDLWALQEWFMRLVFFHELGHHYAEQYRHKRSRIGGRRYREASANLKATHIDRWVRKALDRVRAKK